MTTLRVGIIGAGLRGHRLAQYLAEDTQRFRIVAVQDINLARADYLVRRLNLDAKVYDSLDRLLEDPGLEAVIVATPDARHVEPAVRSLQSGKHVYIEKPMATSLEDADAIVEAARASANVFYMGFNMRSTPFYRQVRRIVREGTLGRIQTIQLAEFYHGGRSYFRRWNRLRSQSGGLWISKAVHDFDLLYYLFGLRPRRVTGVANLFHYHPDPRRGPRCSQCDLASECPDYWDYTHDEKSFGIYTAGDALNPDPPDVCLYNSEKDTFDHGVTLMECEEGQLASYTLSVVSAVTTRTITALGDRGMLQGDLEKGHILVTERFTGRTDFQDVSDLATGTHGGGDKRILEDFHRCVRTGGKPICDWEEGRLALQVALAVRQSQEQGGDWVTLD